MTTTTTNARRRRHRIVKNKLTIRRTSRRKSKCNGVAVVQLRASDKRALLRRQVSKRARVITRTCVEAPAAHQRNTSSNRGDAAGNRLTQSNVGSTRAQLIAAQRSKFERKKMRDIKIQVSRQLMCLQRICRNNISMHFDRTRRGRRS
jgi:hypothetical protein